MSVSANRMHSALAAAVVALAAVGGLSTSPPARAQALSYGFDKGHTNISISWNHLGLSRQQARLMDYDGTVVFDPAAPEKSTIEVTMKPGSLWAGHEGFEKHLRSADFFDVEKHPTMTFKSTAVRKTGDKTGEVVGDLTIMGITKPVTLAVTFNFQGEHPMAAINPNLKGRIVSGFSASTKLNRSEWGLKRTIPLVSDEIQLTIETELVKK